MSKVFKVQATWLEGTQMESETRGFKVLMDKPLEENGTNLAPKPAEVSLQALGSCLLFAYLYAANKLKVTIDGLKVEIEGEVIPGGWQDEQNNKRAGFKTVRFEVQVNTKHSNEDIQKVHDLALKVSPMYDNFSHPVQSRGSFIIQ
jgi:uncharacterized OsmC-like protein